MGRQSKGRKQADIFILIIGLTGAGKSNFINAAAGGDRVRVSDGLMPCTQDIQAIRLSDPRNESRDIVFVDTPGFDDPILDICHLSLRVNKWIKTNKKTLSGILYLYDISQVRIHEPPRTIFREFNGLCSNKGSKNIMVVTTKWSIVSESDGERREKELLNQFLQGCPFFGSKLFRFTDDCESAWNLVDSFISPTS